MVQITHARQYNPKTGVYADRPVSALAYATHRDRYRALEKSGELECHCPDPHCNGVVLDVVAEHDHTYYGQNGQRYRLRVPDYFRPKQGQAHNPECATAKQYEAYRHIVRSVAQMSLGRQSFMINVNVPTHHAHGPVRKLSDKVEDALKEARPPRPYAGASEKHGPLSHGIKDLQGLGRLIQRAAYDPQFAQNLMFHVDGKVMGLDQFYQEKPYDLFRLAQTRHRARQDFAAAAAVFRPATLPRFWKIDKEGPGMIYGQAQKVKATNFYVAPVLHVENRDLYFRLKDDFAAGYNSFLVYSEKIHLIHNELIERNRIAREEGKNEAFAVHIHVSRDEQVVPWTSPPPQKELDFGKPMFDLRGAGQRRRDNERAARPN